MTVLVLRSALAAGAMGFAIQRGLILIGIPLLQPYAWLAFATMCVTIAAALTAQRVWLARPIDFLKN